MKKLLTNSNIHNKGENVDNMNDFGIDGNVRKPVEQASINSKRGQEKLIAFGGSGLMLTYVLLVVIGFSLYLFQVIGVFSLDFTLVGQTAVLESFIKGFKIGIVLSGLVLSLHPISVFILYLGCIKENHKLAALGVAMLKVFIKIIRVCFYITLVFSLIIVVLVALDLLLEAVILLLIISVIAYLYKLFLKLMISFIESIEQNILGNSNKLEDPKGLTIFYGLLIVLNIIIFLMRLFNSSDFEPTGNETVDSVLIEYMQYDWSTLLSSFIAFITLVVIFNILITMKKEIVVRRKSALFD